MQTRKLWQLCEKCNTATLRYSAPVYTTLLQAIVAPQLNYSALLYRTPRSCSTHRNVKIDTKDWVGTQVDTEQATLHHSTVL